MSKNLKLELIIPKKVSKKLYFFILHYNEYENQAYLIHRDFYTMYFESKDSIPNNKIFKVKIYVQK